MAIVPISKLRLISLKSEYEKIAERLTRFHCFEINERDFLIEKNDYSEQLSELAIKRARVDFAINYLLKQSNKFFENKERHEIGFEPSPIKIGSVRDDISAEKLFSIKEREEELLGVVESINQISYRQNEIAHEKRKIIEFSLDYGKYLSFPFKFSTIKNTKETFSLLFRGESNVKMPKLLERVHVETFFEGNAKLVFVLGLFSDRDETVAALGEAGFVPCPYHGDFTAKDAIENENQKLKSLDKESDKLLIETLELTEHFNALKVLFDYYLLLDERYSKNGVASSEYITVLEGWCPNEALEIVQSELLKEFPSIYFDVEVPNENDNVPTLLKNHKLFEPFEDLTAMYTTPAYTDKDPNSLMSIWFFAFFGMMMGDFVYGVMISLGALLFLKLKKSEKGMSNLVKLIGICGVSSMLWGLIFGSFLGFGIQTSLQFFSYEVLENGTSVRYFGWFNPMEKPIMLLGLSLIAGIAHLFFAFCIKAVILIMEKKPFSALCDAGFNMLIIVAIALLGLNIFADIFITGNLNLSARVFSDEVNSILSSAGMICMLVGIGGIFLLAGRESLKNKQMLGWFGAGVNGLYGGIIGLVADILSYSRIFGLGLAGGAIAFAFNTLVEELFFGGGIVIAVIGGVLLFALHVFNLGISLLGTYVHNARLQFLEYYGKFLTGEGKPHLPLGHNTKYNILRK